jgi:hypothetical protein
VFGVGVFQLAWALRSGIQVIEGDKNLSRRVRGLRSERSHQPQTLADRIRPSIAGLPPTPLCPMNEMADGDYHRSELGSFTRQLLNERMDALARNVAILEWTDPRRRLMIDELLRLVNLANTLKKNR